MIGLEVGLNFDFPLVAVGEKFLFIVQKFLSGLRRILEVGTLHDRVDRTRL